MANPLKGEGSSFGSRDLQPGDRRTIHAKDKSGNIIRTYELVRTTRPYAFDLADAYNDGRHFGPSDPRWHVTATGEIQLGVPPGRDEAQWAECKRRNAEWLEDRRIAAGKAA